MPGVSIPDFLGRVFHEDLLGQQRIASPMAAFFTRRRGMHLVGFFKMGVDDDFVFSARNILFFRQLLFTLSANNVAAAEFIEFDPAPISVESDPHTFPGAEGIQGIVEQRAGAIAYDQTHRIVNVDAIAKDIPITQIPRLFFRFVVDFAKIGAFRQIEAKGIIGGLRLPGISGVANAAFISSRQGILLAVKGQVSISKNLLRDSIKPPVDQIKMVGAFVHEQSSALGHIAMPAAKIIGSVTGIEQVFDVDRFHVADGFRGQQLLDLGHPIDKAIIQRHANASVRFLDALKNLAAFFRRNSHRFFRDRFHAQLQAPANVIVVRGIHARNETGVRLALLDHAIEVFGLVRCHPLRPEFFQLPVVFIHADLARIAKSQKNPFVPVTCRQAMSKAAQPSSTTDGDVFFAGRVRGF